ncbi:hypothetical protein Btru_048843 [Bulinus truncatus]|nr:hypothetical protein Btru_048843 [Bulinus truncatus]
MIPERSTWQNSDAHFYPDMLETQRLECHNTSLLTEIKQLHEEREQLTRIIRSHASVCPLTPRQSPLTIIRESPLPGVIRESPLTLPLSAAASILARSPVMGKSPVVVQSPVLLVPPTRESPVPLLILNPTRESPIPGCVIPSSPIPMTGRPRKSPVSILRINQSPIPGEKFGDKSPIPFGSPPKQSKHSIPPRLNLAGPKPVVPILPKPAAANSTPSPKTPLGVAMSPLPTAPSPVSAGGRALHMSPVFFAEGCFTRSGRTRQISQSPISVTDSSNSSTPARITQQSPVFFGDRAPSTSALAAGQFLQPSSASSTSSSSSLASMLRQESPLSIISNSSVFSNNSTVFVGSSSSSSSSSSNSSSLNSLNSGLVVDSTNSLHSNNNNHNNNNINNNSGNNSNMANNMFANINTQLKPPVFMGGSSQSAAREPHDDVLCLEDIERSATGVEARDDLIDFIDIQALLELSGDQGGANANDPTRQGQHDAAASSLNVSQTRNNFDTLSMNHIEDSMMEDGAVHNANVDSDIGQMPGVDGCQSICSHDNFLQSPGFERQTHANTMNRLTQSLLSFDQNLTELSQNEVSFNSQGNNGGQNDDFISPLATGQHGCEVKMDNCNASGMRQDLNSGMDARRQTTCGFGGQQDSAFRGGTTLDQDLSSLRDYFKPHHENLLNPQTLIALQNSLRELLNAQNRLAQCNGVNGSSAPDDGRRINDANNVGAGSLSSATTNNDGNVLTGAGSSLANNNFLSQLAGNGPGNDDHGDSDFMNLQSSFSLDLLMPSPGMCSAGSDSRFSQAGNQYS